MRYVCALFIFAWLVSISACAGDEPIGSIGLGWGPVRENDSTTSYKAVTAGYRLSDHFEATAGSIISGNPNLGQNGRFDYRTTWYGINYVEVESWLHGGVGLVKLTRQTTHLTSPYQFEITFGVHYDAIALTYLHLSNGHTGGKNYGEDMMVLSYGF